MRIQHSPTFGAAHEKAGDQCAIHGLQFELDGRRRGARGSADLRALDLRTIGDLILVRSAGATADFHWQRRFLAPNHLIELRPDGFSILQVLPSGPGRSLLRQFDYTLCGAERPARAAQYLASRLNSYLRPAAIAVAESTQMGIITLGHQAADGAQAEPAVAAFRRQLATLVPVLAHGRPPNDP